MELDLELYRRDVIVTDNPLVRLSAIDLGPPEAQRTLIFLHGFGGRARQWEHQLRFFSEENRVIALDLRGHGLSDAPDSRYGMDELIGDVDRAIAALNVSGRLVLAGHSFGGAIAAEYALRYPERIEKLILVCTPARFVLHPVLIFILRLPTRFLESLRGLFSANFFAPAFVLKRLYFNGMRPWEGRYILPRLTVPTLTIMGHRDIVFPQAVYQEVAHLIPGAQSLIVPVSAHLVMLERPDATNRAIQRFIGPIPPLWREGKPATRLARERPWLKHYDLGVPYTVAIPEQPLPRFLDSAARRYPHRPATIFYSGILTYRELNRLANRFANALQQLGIRPGDRIMLLLPNCPQAVIAYHGALKAGAIVVLSNPLSTEAELEQQVNDCEAQVLVALTLHFPMVQRVKERTGLQHLVLTNIKEYMGWRNRVLFTLLKEGREGHRVNVRSEPGVHRWYDLLRLPSPNRGGEGQKWTVNVSPDDIAVIQYTGGTTAEPKGTMLTHRNLVANMIQVRHWMPDVKEGREVILSVLPFSHVYGMTSCLNVGISLAATLVLLPTFNTREVLESIHAYKVTLFPGVPTMYVAINNVRDVRKYGLSSLRVCVSGAAPLPIEVQEEFEKLTKAKLVEGYGLTEASPVTHVNPLNGLRKRGSIGIPLPNTEAKIVDLRTGLDLPPGEIGELCVRGPQVMKGYWKAPEWTAEVLDADGWLHTGDIAKMDEDGYFYIIDRKKEMIIAGEYNVYPRDVEEVLYEHPKVFEAAVVGVPPGSVEQAVKAVIVLKRGEQATPEEFIAWCRAHLAEHAVPKWVEFRNQLPKTMVGKVLRRLLVEEARDKGP